MDYPVACGLGGEVDDDGVGGRAIGFARAIEPDVAGAARIQGLGEIVHGARLGWETLQDRLRRFIQGMFCGRRGQRLQIAGAAGAQGRRGVRVLQAGGQDPQDGQAELRFVRDQAMKIRPGELDRFDGADRLRRGAPRRVEDEADLTDDVGRSEVRGPEWAVMRVAK